MQRRLKPQMNTDEHRLGPKFKGEAALDVYVSSVFIGVHLGSVLILGHYLHLWFLPLGVLNRQVNRKEGLRGW
jgi:hypothetical protein